MSSLAHIGSWVEDEAPASHTQYPSMIQLSSSTNVMSSSQPSNIWLDVDRSPKSNRAIESLLRPTSFDRDTSAPWHGLSQVKDVREGTEESLNDTRRLSEQDATRSM
ncbi:hypothetical protein PMZ80_007698 [Knufia obscura]|uniref:Uncharacterized protein n=1 Tax=Knufia obscura TaxID=1635080 RepID=A0ABR0RJ35_9EURO|nr:hypothetical protein PMZ80_007698 [Knufia obscura]